MKSKRFLIIVAIVGILLFVPVIAMQFSSEVMWDLTDFVVMGVLLFSAGVACELVLRKVPGTKNRIILCGIILAVLLIIWAELAVGILGTPFAGS
ncbi:hypothetical protein JM83_0414 [Gillisia sp. Hel_I_86]|uniref:hypothetical protein n=1 Tax=Gillisia sp. Hel_I_86 TaxID=1249981 RepID=UPI001198F4D8|nr:hypothetical protein [Gillisia sp. Hel_I_86]TVZ25495.1 hypothetical protein JM83_0414 [Gillisia sp. Hel_I_86]